MARKTSGTPAITWVAPMEKPGAADTALSISVAPTGMRAMRRRFSFSSTPMRSQRSCSRVRAVGLTSTVVP